MPSIIQTVEVTTDDSGRYQRTHEINLSGSDSPVYRADLNAKLLSPADTTVAMFIDIEAADGNPQNEGKQFVLRPGENVNLGSWRLDGGNNIMRIAGQTSPVRSRTDIKIELEVKF